MTDTAARLAEIEERLNFLNLASRYIRTFDQRCAHKDEVDALHAERRRLVQV